LRYNHVTSPNLFVCLVNGKSTSCRRAAATICPAPLLPLWAPKRLAPPSPLRMQTAT